MKHTELIERLVRLSDGSNVWIAIALESVIKRPHDTFRSVKGRPHASNKRRRRSTSSCTDCSQRR